MEGRRRITLYDQMTAGNSTSLADLILHDNVILADQKTDADADAYAAAATTLTASGSCQLSQSRTLVDILREEERHNNTTDRKSRRAFNFMDKLRLKLTLNSKSNYNTGNNNNNNPNSLSQLQTRLYPDELSQQGTTHQQENDVVAVEPENPAEVAQIEVEGPVGVSLMDLLEETDMETGFEVSSHRMSNADFEDANECDGGEEKGEEEGAGVADNNCCVCMVRLKGAAFIPCGHTFCRTCSREVWVSRGNCPLCNSFILEILDIF